MVPSAYLWPNRARKFSFPDPLAGKDRDNLSDCSQGLADQYSVHVVAIFLAEIFNIVFAATSE